MFQIRDILVPHRTDPDPRIRTTDKRMQIREAKSIPTGTVQIPNTGKKSLLKKA